MPNPRNSEAADKPTATLEAIAKDRVVRQTVTRESHLMFFHIYFPHYVKYPIAEFQKDIFRITEDVTIPLACVVAFRGSGKSTLVTFSYALWAILGVQRKKFVVIICQTQAQARQHMVNIRRELENNKLLKSDMGPFQEETGGEWAMSSLVFKNTSSRIMVASVDQSIRGVRHYESRPDLIVLDDVEDMNSTKTMEGRNKTFDWFTREVIPLGDLGTRVILVGNLLHEDSLMMRLRRKIEAKEIRGVFKWFPLIDESGLCLWPGKFDVPGKIEDLRRSVANELAWQQEYLLTIVSDTSKVIWPEWIQYYDDGDMGSCEAKFRYVGIGIDLAISDRDTADYTSMVSARIYGRIEKLHIFILPHPVNERLGFPDTYERVKTMANMQDKEKLKIFIEDVGYQGALIQMLDKDGYPAEGVKLHGADKRSRLALTSHLIKNGTIRFPRTGAEELIQQLTGFGSERHDDLADAFSSLIIKIKEHDVPPQCIGFISFGRDGSIRDTRIELD